LHFVADFFGFAEDAEQVAAQNLADIVGAVPRSSRACVILGRSAAESMPAGVAPLTPSEIRAKTDVVDAGNFGEWSM